MRIVKVPRVNGLGLMGSVGAPDRILGEIGGLDDVDEIEVGNEDIERDESLIFEKAREIFRGMGAPLDTGDRTGQEKVVFVGGDHSISAPIVRAFDEVYDNAFLIVFDAHADCDYVSGNATNEEWLRAVIEGGFKGENVVLIGARKIWDNERRFLTENGVKVFSDIYDIEAIGDYVTEKAMGKDVYVSVDVDVLEPSVAPGVSYPEPNGLTSREMFYLLRRVFRVKGLRAMDVVEVDVVKDEKFDFRTVGMAARIIEALGVRMTCSDSKRNTD